ncbi:MAG: carbohydrate kinase [Mucilaginibacter polytrichastri]|nr:carbohydrate kinase [Mucilaginibacter polytrichastri]
MSDNNPAIFCFGEILWDVLPDKKLPGGAPTNVAYNLNRLGLPTGIISRIGNDANGHQLIEFLQEKDIPTRYVQMDMEQPTSTVQATIDEKEGMKYEIVQPVAWDFIATDEEILSLVGQAGAFIFGSLAARSETSRASLMKLLEQPVKKIFDINLRAPHYTLPFVDELMQQSDILKLNEHELALLADFYGWSGSEEEHVRSLDERFSPELILLTRGGAGAAVLQKEKFFEHPGFTVDVADTIGSGDAFLAGFLSQHLQGKPIEESLAFAAALGAFVASKDGACTVYTEEEIRGMIA